MDDIHNTKLKPIKRPCVDGFCATMDKLGVPIDPKWRALIYFMRSTKDYQIYTPAQKQEIQDLLTKVLKEGGLTEEKFVELSRAMEDILSGPWRLKLQTALTDLARLVGASQSMVHRRAGDIEQLKLSTVEIVQSGKKLEDVVDGICQGFQDVMRVMEEDTEKLTRLSLTDALTKLFNRRALDEALLKATEQAKATGTPLCLLQIDIDHFKAFNDQYGHPIGDQAISTVARVIGECPNQALGGTLFAARYGGEEFTVIAQGMTLEQAKAHAEHIRSNVEKYNFIIREVDGSIRASGIKLTVSLGVALFHDHWKDALDQRLLNAADEALYQAKQAGRNRVITHKES